MGLSKHKDDVRSWALMTLDLQVIHSIRRSIYSFWCHVLRCNIIFGHMSQAEYIAPVSGHFIYQIRPLAMLMAGLAPLMGSASLCWQRLGHNISKLQDKYDQLGTIFPAKKAIIEDSLGYLWIGTTSGRRRYSGSTINCYSHVEGYAGSIDSNRVLFVMMDSDHLIWTAIKEIGINVFDIAGRKILDFEYDIFG